MESLASKYASAIVSIAKEENKCLEYKNSLISLLDTFAMDEAIPKYLESYFVSNDDKDKIIDSLTEPYRLNNLTSFMKLVTRKHLIYKFKEIVKEAKKLLNVELDIEDGYVYSTTELSEDRIQQIEAAIAKKLDHEVELKNIIDPRLIGGVRVVIHDHVYDGSIKNKLENLKENLKERRTA